MPRCLMTIVKPRDGQDPKWSDQKPGKAISSAMRDLGPDFRNSLRVFLSFSSVRHKFTTFLKFLLRYS